jgi:hypothetical protein
MHSLHTRRRQIVKCGPCESWMVPRDVISTAQNEHIASLLCWRKLSISSGPRQVRDFIEALKGVTLIPLLQNIRRRSMASIILLEPGKADMPLFAILSSRLKAISKVRYWCCSSVLNSSLRFSTWNPILGRIDLLRRRQIEPSRRPRFSK